MTVHSGDEQVLWEGETQNVTAKATGGRLTLRYRLTTHFLYFETGGITGTKNEQIPLINVQDVDVSQTLIQKSRKVGNLLVHIIRPTGMTETAVMDSLLEPLRVRDLINHTVHQVRAQVHQRQLAEQQHLNIHRYEATGPIGGPPVLPGVSIASGLPLPVAPPPPPRPQPVQTSEQVMGLLKQLGELRDAGVVTTEEFEAKKRDLLERL